MSKKKVSGSTMTLKDFHGGSIPSDIPLPSAPGVIARPTDRPGYDRQGSWGSNSMGVRSDHHHHRLRPSSSGSMRNLDDNKTPFLTSTANIGRNFDEDERKPLDGGASAPRRTVSDDSVGPSIVWAEPRVDVGKVSGQQPSLGAVGQPVVEVSGSSYSARVVEGGHSGGGVGGGVSARPNAWGVKKEVPGVGERGSSPWNNGQSTVSKLAQASAIDKISSGRWQTKPVQHQVDLEVIRQSDSLDSMQGRESELNCGGLNFASEREYYESMTARHVERGHAIEDGTWRGFKEPDVERVQSPVQNSVLFTNDGQPAHPDAKYRVSQLQQPSEVCERPKLKLHPRTKPLEVQEPSGIDYRQGSQQSIDTNSRLEAGSIHGNANHVKPRPSSSEASRGKPGVNGSEVATGHQVVERPKLNLKPRSQSAHQSDGNTERKALFGGARPRELVLKERGVDDVVNSHDELHSPSWLKNESPRAEVALALANTSRLAERVDNLSIDQRTGRGHEKRDQRADIQRADVQRKNWRNDNWRSGREPEKQQQEWQPSPETWRKPVEQPNVHSGLRYGKVVSAVDLAQAFSKSVSSPKPVDQFFGQRGSPGQRALPGQRGSPGQRGHPGQKEFPGQKGHSTRSHVPFSRLAGPTTRPQINGY